MRNPLRLQGHNPFLFERPHAEDQPFEPNAPSVDYLKKRICSVLRNCQRIRPTKNFLQEVFETLHIQEAEAEKRLKIAEVLSEIESSTD